MQAFLSRVRIFTLTGPNQVIPRFSERFSGIAKAPYKPGDKLNIHLFVDASSAELFIDNGRLVMTSLFFPSDSFSKLRLFSKGGNAKLGKAELNEFGSIWK